MAGDKRYEIAVIRGGANDGSGPEMMDAALTVLKALLEEAKVTSLKLTELDLVGEPDKSWDTIRSLGVVFKAPTNTPHDGRVARLLGSTTIRKGLDLYANITPSKSYKGITKALRPDIDMVMVRENVEGLFSSPYFSPAPGVSCNVRTITQAGSERIARVAFQLAQRRRKKVTVSTVPPGAIQSDGTFTEACETVAREFPDVKMEIFKPDSVCGMLMDRPDYFDVVVAPNDWGFILQDGMVATTGSVGLGPRANLGDNTALFEPVHGTAPGKAGKGTVNPISQTLAGKMMLEWLGNRNDDAQLLKVASRLERAVTDVLDGGKFLTVDLGGSSTTRQLVDAIIERAITLRD